MIRSRPLAAFSLLVALAVAVGLTGCDSTAFEPGSPSGISDVSVDATGEVTVSWDEYTNDDFQGYALYRAQGTQGYRQVQMIESAGTTSYSETIPNFLGGRLAYRVDVIIQDSVAVEGEPVIRQFPTPDMTADVSPIGGTVRFTWPATRFPDALKAYEIQSRIGDGEYRTDFRITVADDTSRTFNIELGEPLADVRVRAIPVQDTTQATVGTPAEDVGVGTAFPEFDRLVYNAPLDSYYLVNQDTEWTYRLSSDYTPVDSVQAVVDVPRGGEQVALIEPGASFIRRLDPETLDLVDNYDAADIPEYDPDGAPIRRTALLPGGRLAYTTFSGFSQEEVNVYNVDTGSLVGQTDEGVDAEVLSFSISGNYAVIVVDGNLELWRIGPSTVEYLRDFNRDTDEYSWTVLADGSDAYVGIDGSSTVELVRVSDGSIETAFDVSVSFSDVRAGGGGAILFNDFTQEIHVLDLAAGTVTGTIPYDLDFNEDLLVRNGRVFLESGYVLTLP